MMPPPSRRSSTSGDSGGSSSRHQHGAPPGPATRWHEGGQAVQHLARAAGSRSPCPRGPRRTATDVPPRPRCGPARSPVSAPATFAWSLPWPWPASSARSARSSSSAAVSGSSPGRDPHGRGQPVLQGASSSSAATTVARRRAAASLCLALARRRAESPRTRRPRSGRCRRTGGTRLAERVRHPLASSWSPTRCPCRSFTGLKLSRSISRQHRGSWWRRARAISSRICMCRAPWLSRPVSESVRAAVWARSNASALLRGHRRQARRWPAGSARSSSVTRRME